MDNDRDAHALAWQTGVWDKMSSIYWREVDHRLTPVVDALTKRAGLRPGDRVLDLGTGTGAVARQAAAAVGPGGNVVGTDISPEMLAIARKLSETSGVADVEFRPGRAEDIPLPDASVDVVLANLVMMYVLDREEAARRISRVLKPGGRFVASFWAGPEQCDIVRFQQTAGKFAPPPPVTGVGPGALADPAGFLAQLDSVGIEARVERETLGFDFPDFASAWSTLAGVTTAQLPEERQREARGAVLSAMYPDGDQARHFRNVTQFVVGRKRG